MTTDFPSDDRLIQDIARGGRRGDRAVTVIFDRYSTRLMGFFRRKGFPKEDAEDLLQESFLKFIRHIIEKRGSCTIGLLWHAAGSLSIDHLRAKYANKRDESISVSLERAVFENLPAEEVNDEGLMDCVDGSIQAFRRAEPTRADTIERVIIEGWGMKEVADYLGRSYGATRQYVYECRKKLREIVRERCSEYLTDELN